MHSRTFFNQQSYPLMNDQTRQRRAARVADGGHWRCRLVSAMWPALDAIKIVQFDPLEEGKLTSLPHLLARVSPSKHTPKMHQNLS